MSKGKKSVNVLGREFELSSREKVNRRNYWYSQ